MGVRTGAYATVWSVKKGNGNYYDVQLSTSRKNKQTGNYETDFSGFTRFVGTAANEASNLKEKDRIKIGDCEITNQYVKEKNTTYYNVAVFSFEKTDGNSGKTNTPAKATAPKDIPVPDIGTDIDEELPFN